MRRFQAKIGGLAFVSLNARFNSSNDTRKLAMDVRQVAEKIAAIEESRAHNALVSVYASRKLKDLGVKGALQIFADPSFNSAIYCHAQLPVMLAKLITEMDNLPSGLNAMPAILSVRETLLSSFSKLIECPIPISADEEAEYRNVLVGIEDLHADRDIVRTMAIGIMELKYHLSRHKKALFDLKQTSPRWANIDITVDDVMPYGELQDIQEPLNRCNQYLVAYNFFSRMLLNTEPGETTGQSDRVGMVDLHMNIESVVRNAVDEAKQICTDHYGDCPDVKFTVNVDKSIHFSYMGTTIRYIVIELMKNAFRATVESHEKRNEMGIIDCSDMPAVEVLIHLMEHTEHACIRISDEGMGMTQDALDMAMSYAYTSADDPALQIKDGRIHQSESTNSLAGYGYGLPLSRVYAYAFGGDLAIQSMEGYGTRVYYYIKL